MVMGEEIRRGWRRRIGVKTLVDFMDFIIEEM